jgi:hypothetical protein
MTALLLLAALTADAPPVRIYVFTKADPSGFVDPASTRRTDSVKVLREALSKRKGLTLVDDPASAHVQIEVTASGYEGTGETSGRASPTAIGTVTTTSATEVKVIRATLRVGTTPQNRIPASALSSQGRGKRPPSGWQTRSRSGRQRTGHDSRREWLTTILRSELLRDCCGNDCQRPD